MLIWLIKDGETLPVQTGARPMRTGMLANELLRRGHSVVWWSSTFSHQRKTLLYEKDTVLEVEPGFELNLIYAGRYQKNISLRRYFHHRVLARRFSKRAREKPAPDIIVCAFPTIDLAYKAVSYAMKNGVPIIIDIRDLWPDTFLDKTPNFLRPIARVLLWQDFFRTKEVFRRASSLTAISKGCLRWGLRYAERHENHSDQIFYTGYPEENNGQHEMSERIKTFKQHVEGKIVFTFVGSFGHSYELNLICEAAKRLIEMGFSHIHFALAGDGEQFESVSKNAQSLANLSLLGWLDKFEIVHLLKLSHIGLVPCMSVPDAMPNKPFEYLSASLPILSSLQGEMETIIADHNIGYSYKSGDLDTFVKLVVKLASEERLRVLQSHNAEKLFQSKFSSRIIYKAYADHVEEIAREKGEK